MNKYFSAFHQMCSAYPNTIYSRIKNFFKIMYRYFIIVPFYSNKNFIIHYIWGLKTIGNKNMDGQKYTFLLPTIDFGIKFLEYTYLSKGDIFIDIGANIGNHTLIGLKKGAYTHSFEPNSRVLSYLQKNIDINKLDKKLVHLNNNLVGDHDKEVVFYQYDDNQSGISSYIKPKDGNIKTITKKMISMDSYLTKNHIKRVKILKIDVEGAEPFVFQGAKDSLKNGVFDVIFRESNHVLKIEDKQKIIHDLEKYGYKNFEFGISEKDILPYKSAENCLSIHITKIDLIKNLLKHI